MQYNDPQRRYKVSVSFDKFASGIRECACNCGNEDMCGKKNIYRKNPIYEQNDLYIGDILTYLYIYIPQLGDAASAASLARLHIYF